MTGDGDTLYSGDPLKGGGDKDTLCSGGLLYNVGQETPMEWVSTEPL